MNIHLINTVGVAEADIARCIECWCLDAEAALRGNYYGGTACCSPLNCPTKKGSDPPTIYFLQYNVSYRRAPCTSYPSPLCFTCVCSGPGWSLWCHVCLMTHELHDYTE